ncbi:Transposase IS116/IS110/IS902 family protein [Enhygromyxa salina]|uniref:Transposase IS116/IS110/IS902 family protein n=1 Tax=Enhygromyxa salina TaxID=215803 RepID=A0A2S9YD21_9BACT|nr:IS110 family transposase [Enhygromyxa salina]PRQ02916.1 Transposase IS116/IS110/IS902 family protein [Enhygromyxa salina]
MRYLGIDVHSSASVWCLLDQSGEQIDRGRSPTTYPALCELASRLSRDDELLAGHEVGGQVYLVHDAISAAGVTIQAFNANHLRMIAASRKKTDKRDAYWIAKALQTGMTPHPVYIPNGEVRELRRLLARRRMVMRDRKRWQYRARAILRSYGVRVSPGNSKIRKKIDEILEHPDGADTDLLDSLGLCERAISLFNEECADIDKKISIRTGAIDVVQRLRTIPGVGDLVSANIYAAIGEINRFSNARKLASYAGLVPTVSQTGGPARIGHITKEGSSELRAIMVQAAHIASRPRTKNADELRAYLERIRGSRGRKKIALTALARYMLNIAFHIWRDGTEYDPKRMRCNTN